MASTTVPVTAQMVGNAFVTQYYNVLHQMPHIVYRFYTDQSRLTRADAGSAGKTQTAATQDEIHRVVTSLDHENCRAEIMTVDALDSFGGSVFVLVTGAMHKNNSTRKFVQSFFLAPQDRGYYVLNDIFRYLDEATQTAAASENKGSNGLRGMYESSQMTSNAVVPEASDFKSPAIDEEALVAEELQFSEHSGDADVEHQDIEEVVTYQTREALSLEDLRPVEQLPLVDDIQPPPLEDVHVPAAKMSYASILRLQRDSHASSQTAVAFHQTVSNPEQSLSSQQHISLSQLSSAHAPAEAKRKPLPVENEVDLKSVYVKNLPANIMERQLEDEMRKFGPVKLNSITLRSNKDGGLYAFVDFEDSISAQAAIEASPVLIGGRKAHIEERKSTYSGGIGRGRGRGQGRGMLQNNGSRARGTYSLGVSGRGSSVYGDADVINRGRGVWPDRGVYSGASTRAPSSNNQ